MRSPAFSEFRSLMDIWDTYCEGEKTMASLASFIGEKEFSFFFEFEGSIYGAPEESRVIFAKMKHPDETVNAQWRKDANFSGTKIDGLPSERIFGMKDLKNVHVMDQEKAMNTISEKDKQRSDDDE